MKKIALISAATLLAASTVAFADDMDMNQHNGTGFYAGADIGYVQAKVGDSDTVKPDGVRGGIFAGYGVKMDNNFYLGAEAKFSMSNASEKDTLYGSTAEFDQDNSFSLAVRPGYFINNNILIYGNAGWVNTKFEDKLDYFGLSQSATKRLNGAQLGAGIEYKFTDQLSTRVEYLHDFYEDWDTIDYSSDEVNLGITWNFG